jgi:hypothetical protein
MKLWVALILFTCAYAIWPLMWEGFFYQAIALAFLFLFWHVLRSSDVLRSSASNLPAKIGFWFSVNAIIDELFFDPTEINWNEYIFGLLIIEILWQDHRRKKRAKS